MNHIVLYEHHRTLVDRQTFALLSHRSEHTIRAKCPVATYHDGKALYDMEHCAAILQATPSRHRTAAAA